MTAAMSTRMMIHGSRSPALPVSGTGIGRGDADGDGDGLALGAADTGVTTTWIPDFGLPLVMTGTPAALRHVAPLSPTSAVTT